jgi:succinate-semialdehyde dehydrogenase/glutarate-semialdehyde dehydrogenase
MKIVSRNPFNQEVNGEFDLLTAQQIETETAKSRQAFLGWKSTSMAQRQLLMGKLAAAIGENERRCAETITREMGKPIKESLSEVQRCAGICAYCAEYSESLFSDEPVRTGCRKSYIAFEPLGIVLAIMPWNFPFMQVFRCAIPAIAAGNVVLLKHASNVPMSALVMEELFAQAGFPSHVFRTLLIDAASAMKLIQDDKVDGVSLTGSYQAGVQIGTAAGSRIKRQVLELGGSDPFIVLDDADLDKTAQAAVLLRFRNAGQTCVAAKRYIVMESVARPFTELVIRHLGTLKMGDPLKEETNLGPMAMRDSLKDLQRQLDDAVAKGAAIVEGPAPPNPSFFRPVLITNANPSMAIAQEEVFGPIASIFVVKNEEEILSLANATEFGLGATIWSRNLERAERLSRRINSGIVAINRAVQSDPLLPFGGIKKSGLGRELSHYGFKEFVNIKTIMMDEG